MNELFKDAPVTVSIIDYLGKIENGVGLLLSIVAGETTYEVGYWFNKEGSFRITPEPKLLKTLGVEDIYEYQYVNELIFFIHSNLPDTDKILEEFLK